MKSGAGGAVGLASSSAVEGLGRGPNWLAPRPAGPLGAPQGGGPRQHKRRVPQKPIAPPNAHPEPLAQPSTNARPPFSPRPMAHALHGPRRRRSGGTGHLTHQIAGGRRGACAAFPMRHQGPNAPPDPAIQPIEMPPTPAEVVARLCVRVPLEASGRCPHQNPKPTTTQKVSREATSWLISTQGTHLPGRAYLCLGWDHISRMPKSRRQTLSYNPFKWRAGGGPFLFSFLRRRPSP